MADNLMTPKQIFMNILIGLVVYILSVILVNPTLPVFGDAVIWIGTHISSSILNLIVKNAALGLREDYSWSLYGVYHIITLVILVYGGISFYTLNKMISEVENKMKKPQIIKYLDKVLEPKIYSKISATYIVFAIFLIIVQLTIMTMNFMSYNAIVQFNQRMIILESKISDQQSKDLRAEWALMATVEDFNNVKDKVKTLAQENNLKMPDSTEVILWF